MSPHTYRIIAAAITSVALVGCGGSGEETPKPVDFATQIKPLLQEKCIACHNTGLLLGKLNLESRDLAFAESERGKFIVPGDPEASLLYTMTLSPHGKREPEPGIEKPMPLEAPDLSQEEKDLLKSWIKEGAAWPDGAGGNIKPPAAPEPGS